MPKKPHWSDIARLKEAELDRDRAVSKKAMSEIDALFAPAKKAAKPKPKPKAKGGTNSLLMEFISTPAAKRAAEPRRGGARVYRKGAKA